MPGVMIRKPLLKRLPRRRSHRVRGLPGDQHRHDGRLAGPVAIFIATRNSSGFDAALPSSRCVPDRAVARPPPGDLRQPDVGFDRLDLTEEGLDA